MSRGIVYVAFGKKAILAQKSSEKTLRKVSSLPVFLINKETFGGPPGFGARWAKLNIDKLTPFNQTLYLDADTMVHQPIDKGFEVLENWDMVLAPSINQGGDSFKHLDSDERLYTQKFLGEAFPFQLQLGVFYFNKVPCKDLFVAWREEWQKYETQDQGAFLRALFRVPTKIWLLGRPYNSVDRETAIIEHLFGRAA